LMCFAQVSLDFWIVLYIFITVSSATLISVIYTVYLFTRSQYSSVSISTGYGMDSLGSIPGRGNRFFSTPQHPDQLWDPSSLLSNGY
jgi:hypothetical protein